MNGFIQKFVQKQFKQMCQCSQYLRSSTNYEWNKVVVLKIQLWHVEPSFTLFHKKTPSFFLSHSTKAVICSNDANIMIVNKQFKVGKSSFINSSACVQVFFAVFFCDGFRNDWMTDENVDWLVNKCASLFTSDITSTHRESTMDKNLPSTFTCCWLLQLLSVLKVHTRSSQFK